MSTQRAHYVLPTDLVSDIKELAGPRGSSAFVAETLRVEVRKRKLLEFIEDLKREPAWKDEDHPDLVKLGTAAWVRKQRAHKGEGRKQLEKTWWNRK